MKVLLDDDAEADVDVIDAWWRENRKESPDLFRDELTAVVELLSELQRNKNEQVRARDGVRGGAWRESPSPGV